MRPASPTLSVCVALASFVANAADNPRDAAINVALLAKSAQLAVVCGERIDLWMQLARQAILNSAVAEALRDTALDAPPFTLPLTLARIEGAIDASTALALEEHQIYGDLACRTSARGGWAKLIDVLLDIQARRK